MVFLHRFEHGRLSLGGRPVDFVGQDHVGEDGAFDEYHLPLMIGLLEDLRPGDVGGHEVRRKLDTLKCHMEQLRQGLDQQGLGQTGRPGHEAVPAGEDRDEQMFDHVTLTDDDLAQLGTEALPGLFDLLDRQLFGFVRFVSQSGLPFLFPVRQPFRRLCLNASWRRIRY